jgi:serine protease inhibitor
MFSSKRAFVLTGFMAVIAVLSLGCQKGDVASAVAPVNEEIVDAPHAAEDVAAANQKFAFDLYRELAMQQPGQNLFFSPYSVSSALMIAAEGARGETAAQMGEVLRFPDSLRQIGTDAELIPWNVAEMHAGLATWNRRFSPKPVPPELRDEIETLRKDLDRSNRLQIEARASELVQDSPVILGESQQLATKLNSLLNQFNQYEIRQANALWAEKTYALRPAYLETIQKFYGRETLFPVDFKRNPEAAREQINNWVEDRTNKLIRKLIPEGSVDIFTRLVLTNAIYFNGEWENPFPEDQTQSETFTNDQGAESPVQMMHENRRQDVRYGAFKGDGTFFLTPKEIPAEGEPDPATLYPDKNGFQMLQLPYKGYALGMVVIMPQDAKRLDALEQLLQGEQLQNCLKKLQSRDVRVYLPKFRLETTYALKSTLVAMGMSRAFNSPSSNNGAQFEGISEDQDAAQSLYINEVLHKAFVEVNEKRTEAAASVSTWMSVESIMPDLTTVPFTPTFRANKPFSCF